MGDVVNEHKRSSIDIEKPSASSDGKSVESSRLSDIEQLKLDIDQASSLEEIKVILKRILILI